MRSLTEGQKKAAIDAWLDGSALMDAALIVATFVAEDALGDDDREIRMRRENAIASLPVLMRVMKERLQPADTVLINYDFAVREPEVSKQ